MSESKWVRGVVSFIVACAIMVGGEYLLNTNLELWWGLDTFNWRWFIAVFILPFIAGTAMGLIYGLGSYWLCYFPPIAVRLASYFYYDLINPAAIPENASLLPMGWWGFFVILAFEAAAFGGVAGEILLKKTYGRLPREQFYKQKTINGAKPEN